MAQAQTSAQPIENTSFEKALAELETIVSNLENGRAPLEESIKLYERGILLKNHCEQKLQEARLKIEKISLGPNGAPRTEAFDIKE